MLDLDGFFGLHPAMASFQPLWQQKHLAIVHAAGSPDPTRSHFDAQDFMESGTPGIKVTDDGWLNRALRELPGVSAKTSRRFAPSRSGRRCRAFSPARSRPSRSTISTIFPSEEEIRRPRRSRIRLKRCTNTPSIRVLHGTGQETFDAVKMLKAADPAHYTPAANANYPKGRFGDSLKQLAQLIKANLGVQVAFADIGGWDHHVNEGNTQGQIANVLGDFSQSIAAFWTDLGDLGEDTVVVTMSEFGRTARENGNRGTDHGHANVMFVLGGPVRGGKVYGRWPGLDQSQLYEGRDLALTTDFRLVLGEVVSRYLGNKDLKTVFPGFEAESTPQLRILA